MVRTGEAHSIRGHTGRMSFDTLAALADRAALFAALRQDQLRTATEALGDHRWDADLEAGRLTFSSTEDPDRSLVAVPELLASIAPGPRSLMWAWAMPDGHRSGIAERLLAYGAEHGVDELTQGEVAFPDDTGDDLDGWIAQLARTVAGAAMEITGQSPFLAAPVGGGTVAVLLLDAPLEPLTVSAAVAALPRLLPGIRMRDPRASVWDLGRLAGWQLAWADDAFTAATVTDASGSAVFRFDEYARIAGITSTS